MLSKRPALVLMLTMSTASFYFAQSSKDTLSYEKKIDEVLEILPKNENYYFVKPNVNRGRNPETYEDLLKKSGISYKIFQTVQDGYLSARQICKAGEMIFVGGSNFVVGDFLEKNL